MRSALCIFITTIAAAAATVVIVVVIIMDKIRLLQASSLLFLGHRQHGKYQESPAKYLCRLITGI